MASIVVNQIKKWWEAVVAVLTVAASSLTNLISAYTGTFLLIFSTLFIAAVALYYLSRSEKIKEIARGVCVFSAVFSVTLLFVFVWHKRQLSKVKANELVYEMTQEFCTSRQDNIPWVTETALLSDSICFIATKRHPGLSEAALDSLLNDLLDEKKLSEDYLFNGRGKFVVNYVGVVDNQYQAVVTPKCFLRDEIHPDYIVLPYSTALCVVGKRRLRAYDWPGAKECFEKAAEQGNAFATYWLAQMNKNGIGQTPDVSKGRNLLKAAAESGLHAAQYEWAHDVLYDEHSSAIDRATAEEFLVMATKMIDFRTFEGLIYFINSIDDLQEYYTVRKDYLSAYLLTKRLCRDYRSYLAPHVEHIQNCLKLHLRSEALSVIRQCEKLPKEQVIEENLQRVYLIHSMMYQEGVRVPKDLRRAEMLLRFASDSLDYKPARKALSEFYDQQGYSEEARFFGDLYDARYSNKITSKEEQR